jgi:hypothetical protein
MLIGVIAEETLLPLAIAPDRIWDGGPLGSLNGGDIFWRPRSTIIGFVMPDLVDETDIVLGAENFFNTYITNGYQGIFPDLFGDTVPEIFYDFTHSFIPVLKPTPWIDSDLFYSATIPFNPPLFPTVRYVDSDIFYTPAFLSSVTSALVVDNDVILASVIRRDGDAIVLLLEAFNDNDTIFATSIGSGLLPGLVIENYPIGDFIYSAGQSAFLRPDIFSSADTFFAPFTFNQLNPSLVPVDDVFIGPELGTPGRLELFVDDDFFPAASVQFASLLAPLVTETDDILSALIGSNPALGPLDGVIDFDNEFYAPSVIIFQGLAPHFWPDVDTILSVPAVILGQALAPSILFSDADAFYVPVLPPTLSPALFAPADIFFAPVLIFDQLMLPSWMVDADAFLAPSMTALAGWDGAISLDGPIMPAAHQPTVIYIED